MIENYYYTQKEQDTLLKSLTILIDTREKDGKNDHIIQYFDSMKVPWKYKKLEHGDYSCFLPANDELGIPRDYYFTNEICIERKASLSEWGGNLSADRAAIKKKFSLAPKNTILLIENGSYADMVNGNYYGNYSAKAYWSSFHSIWHEFGVPIIFMPDSRLSGLFIIGYFKYYVHNIIKN